MRRVWASAAHAGLALVLAAPAGARQLEVEITPRDLLAWLDAQFPDPPAGIEVNEVGAVHSADAITDDPAEGQLPNLVPTEWATFRLSGEPGAFTSVFGGDIPSSASTPAFDQGLSEFEEGYLFFVRVVGPVDTFNGTGFNINFDRDPAVNGLKLDGNPTAGDCAIDAFEGGGESSLTSSMVETDGTDFAPVDAPLFRVFHDDAGFFVLPDGHPCTRAQSFSPSAVGVAGTTAIKHQVLGPDGNAFLPFDPSRIVITGAPPADGGGGEGAGAGTGVTSSADDADGGGGGRALPYFLSAAAFGVVAGGTWYGVRRFRGGDETPPTETPPVDPERLAKVEYAFRMLDHGDLAGAQALIREVLDAARAENPTPPTIDPTAADKAKTYIEYVAGSPPEPSITVDLKELGGRVSAYIDALAPPVEKPPPLSDDDIDAGLRWFGHEWFQLAPVEEGETAARTTMSTEPDKPVPANPEEGSVLDQIEPEETLPPTPQPGSEAEFIIHAAQEERALSRIMEGEDPSLDDQGRALGHLLDDTDIREVGDDVAPVDRPEAPDSLKLQHADPEPEEGSVLDQIDEPGEPGYTPPTPTPPPTEDADEPVPPGRGAAVDDAFADLFALPSKGGEEGVDEEGVPDSLKLQATEADLQEHSVLDEIPPEDLPPVIA